MPGPSPPPYQPTPKPSPLVVSAPIRECRLWSTSPCWVLNSSSSISSGCPDQAIHLHMGYLLGDRGAIEHAGRAAPARRVDHDRARQAVVQSAAAVVDEHEQEPRAEQQ